MIFLNPWGALALLGIPIVLYIHMLQRRSKRLPVSTLFLLEAVQPERKAGKKIEKLRNSRLLWLNLLTVVLLTWLLIQPRKIQSRRILKAAVVVDVSASMQVCHKKAGEQLFTELASLSQGASGIELTLMSSILEEQTIYSGSDLEQAKKQYINYIPSHPGHDVVPALRRAQSLLNNDGLLVLISDHEREVPEGTLQILAGEKIKNVGFTGFSAKSNGKWRAMVRNYSTTPQKVTWWAGVPQQTVLFKSEISLEAGGMKTLQGEFLTGQDQLILTLSEDAFSMDNKICAIRPLQKQIQVQLAGLEKQANESLHKLLLRLAQVKISEQGADFSIVQSLGEPPTDQPGIFWPKVSQKAILSRGEVLALNHDLMEGLVWQGLSLPILTKADHFEDQKGDEPLLKLKQENIIVLRETSKGPQILINMDLNVFDIMKSPALMILIHRSLQATRTLKKSYSQINSECNNILTEASWQDSEMEVTGAQLLSSTKIELARDSGFFSVHEIKEGKKLEIMQGACFFADAGEADFSEMVKKNDFQTSEVAMSEVLRESDFLKPLWLLSVILICLYAWLLIDRKEQVKRQAFEALV
jgi:hypothetical protein